MLQSEGALALLLSPLFPQGNFPSSLPLSSAFFLPICSLTQPRYLWPLSVPTESHSGCHRLPCCSSSWGLSTLLCTSSSLPLHSVLKAPSSQGPPCSASFPPLIPAVSGLSRLGGAGFGFSPSDLGSSELSREAQAAGAGPGKGGAAAAREKHADLISLGLTQER